MNFVPNLRGFRQCRGNDSDKENSSEKPLNKYEKAVLHYAVGYIPRKLLAKFARNKSNRASQLFLEVVKTWAIPREYDSDGEEITLTEDVTEWSKQIDRGGLIHCSPKFFGFMKVVENNLRVLLNTITFPSFAEQNIVPIVAGKLKCNKQVQEHFKNLIDYCINDAELYEALLDEVLSRWVAIRARQVAKKYTFEIKMSNTKKASRMGTPALRKTLDKV